MRHPQLKTISSNGIDGEVHFFDRPENLNRGIEYYLEMMPETTEDQITFEKVSVYTSLNGIKRNMSEMSKDTCQKSYVMRPLSDRKNCEQHLIAHFQW